MLVYAMFFSNVIRSVVVLDHFLTNSGLGMWFIHMSLYTRSKVSWFSFAFGSSFVRQEVSSWPAGGFTRRFGFRV